LPVLAFVAAALVIGLGSWWTGWGKRTLEGFVGDLSQGRLAAAHERLAPPCAIEQRADGSVRIVDASGTATEVPPGGTFAAGGASGSGSLPRRFQDVVLGRVAGEVSAIVRDPAPMVVVLHLTCTRDEVTIDAVTAP
jgi:hypothetical protein